MFLTLEMVYLTVSPEKQGSPYSTWGIEKLRKWHLNSNFGEPDSNMWTLHIWGKEPGSWEIGGA